MHCGAAYEKTDLPSRQQAWKETVENMTKIKICGLKSLADVAAVNACLPEYAGFVFANTKRFVTDEQALAMRRALDKRIQTVGVFVNEPAAHIAELCRRGIIDAVQLHGEETDAYIRALRNETDTIVIKAVKMQDSEQAAEQMSQEADYMLFDTYKRGVLGGTGERFCLDILEEALAKAQAKSGNVKPYFLAGGLASDNITAVLGRAGNCGPACYAVDVSTGVETDGVKDAAKIKEFVNLVRNMERPEEMGG